MLRGDPLLLMYLNQQNREAAHTIAINSKTANPAHLSIRRPRRERAMSAVYRRAADIQIAGCNMKGKDNGHKEAKTLQKKNKNA